MPVDIVQENYRTTFSHNFQTDQLNPSVIDEIKGIWSENNNEYEKYNINSILQSSECLNGDYPPLSLESFNREILSFGFIVGQELEIVKAKSRRSLMQQMSNHISKNFQSLYGKENNGVRQSYFQIGVRVPSKEHVSEIVGKQGLKIKEIREKTGALIITPGESEDHVFIIEATPLVAITVAKFIDERASEITTNRARDNYQKSMIFNTPNRFNYVKPFSGICTSRPILATGVIEVPKNIVGRIIGTHGSIITTIQKDTGTEIRSPPKENHLSNNNCKAKFEILVYQKSNSIDIQEAVQRIKNAKQLIAHVAMHQMERIRAEESPFSNYRIKSFSVWEANNCEKSCPERNSLSEKEKLLNYQMQSVAWMWNDIDRLEEHVSEEVVLRILEESKKKSKQRTDYGNFDSVNISIDRFEDISIQSHNQYGQGNNFPNGYDVSSYSSPSIFSDLSPIKNPTSPNHLSGVLSDSPGSPYCSSTTFLPLNMCTTNDFNLNAMVNVTSTSNSVNSRPTTLTYKTPLLAPTDHLTTKSYAEHLKTFSTISTTNNHQATITTASSSFSSSSINNIHNHGAIGDHIKRSNQTKTAQFDKIK